MTGLRSIVIKFSVFAVVSALLGVLLLNTMLNNLSGDKTSYEAMFRDVSGLRVGDDIRVAGVRVGRVQSIDVDLARGGAKVGFQLVKDQPLLSTTHMVMRYQNLLGQRYLALVQEGKRGPALRGGSTLPFSHTDPGFDLTELLNGFRPLFDALRPGDVNALATSMIKVLQGEGGTVQSLLAQTAKLTNYLADRDKVVGQVIDNLVPVLTNMAGQGTELRATVAELKELMIGLAHDRKAIGASIDGTSQLIGTTSQMLKDTRQELPAAVKNFRAVMEMFMANRERFVAALGSFGTTLAAFGRSTSYENALNVYFCSVIINAQGQKLNLNLSDNGPWSAVCR